MRDPLAKGLGDSTFIRFQGKALFNLTHRRTIRRCMIAYIGIYPSVDGVSLDIRLDHGYYNIQGPRFLDSP